MDREPLLGRFCHGAFVAWPEWAGRQDGPGEDDAAFWQGADHDPIRVDREAPVRCRGVWDEAAIADQLRHPSAEGRGHHFVRGPELELPAVVDDPEPTTEGLRFGKVVGHEDPGRIPAYGRLDGEDTESLACGDVDR